MSRLVDSVRTVAWHSVLRVTGNTMRELAQLQQWERLAPEPSRAVAADRLRTTLARAWQDVPFWRTALGSAGIVSASGEADERLLAQLPVLDKATMRAELQTLIARREGSGAYWNTSGGSTGEPVRFRQDAAYKDAVRAAAMLFNTWAGYAHGRTMVKVWGSERDLFDGGENARTRMVRWLRGEVWLNAFRMTPAQISAHLETINRLRPSFVLGYVESVYDLARAAEVAGIRMSTPRGVMTSAGPLELPVRDVIRRVFGAPVFNRYGSREVGDVACDCAEGTGLHVITPYHHVEILRPDGTPCIPGEVGEVVLTLLTNRTMPLIRYRIGDTAAWATGECPCGRSWPRLATVTGRISDMFVRPDGARIHGEYFTHLFYFLDWVSKFQVVQHSPQHIELLIVLRERHEDAAAAHAAALAEIVSKVRLVMGPECRVDLSFPDSIAPSASGKFRYTISHVVS